MTGALVAVGGLVLAGAAAVLGASDGPNVTENLSLWQAGVTIIGFVILGAVGLIVGRRKLNESTQMAVDAARAAADQAAGSWQSVASAEVERREAAEITAAACQAKADALETEIGKLHDKTDLSPLLERLSGKWADHTREHAGILAAAEANAKLIELVADRLSEESTARGVLEDRIAQALNRNAGALERLLTHLQGRPAAPKGSEHPLERSGESQFRAELDPGDG